MATRQEAAMPDPITRRRLAVATASLALVPAVARAHHGWAWAEEALGELSGTIREVYIGYPHPTLRVDTGRDGVWLVELANPSQTERAGFTATSAAPGDAVVALGNRPREPGEKRLKAVRVTVRDRRYDLYPERIPERLRGS